ncbi:hypothetical protein M427DRAFT_44896 [Gonapodya prolifera JEL478]|uniref:Uncharacterized protein n=1 Tax=Gonapodya prolifera (strain JEL478) TaxID=1344416 RepID=A0A139ADH2_GONPJ|nr:hypothetical protein M427DRAFT_44896 [Gonapodya prolifera JEL478]|eukprot:KXS14709.1 hypothetical protein M427DRAFT_44896 [Gonapodya prolifera JEL478]
MRLLAFLLLLAIFAALVGAVPIEGRDFGAADRPTCPPGQSCAANGQGTPTRALLVYERRDYINHRVILFTNTPRLSNSKSSSARVGSDQCVNDTSSRAQPKGGKDSYEWWSNEKKRTISQDRLPLDLPIALTSHLFFPFVASDILFSLSLLPAFAENVLSELKLASSISCEWN